MPPRRMSELPDRVTLRVDGTEVPAAPGEPVAVALAATGRLVLGRSVKYHRPRGAACYATRCDGCLMRVDGVPNVMTCRVPARDGLEVETQNVLGSARADLLAATDWFYPQGMDHHEMFTRFKPVNRMMQRVARRIAGVGRLPDEAIAPVPPRELSPDVLVIGAGPAGLTVASECAGRGLDVCIVEDAEQAGGHLRLAPFEVRTEDGSSARGSDLADRMLDAMLGRGATWLPQHAAVGVYEEPGRGSPVPSGPGGARPDAQHLLGPPGPPVVAVAATEGLLRVRPGCLVVATGAEEGVLAVPGNDLPGVMSGRAALRLLVRGVLPGERVAVVGEGPWAAGISARIADAGAEVVGPIPVGRLAGIRGRPHVKAIDLCATEEGKPAARERCDAVALVAPTSAVYEVAAQAGAHVVWQDDRFAVQASEQDGATAVPWLRAVGECVLPNDLPRIVSQARGAAAAIVTYVEQTATMREGGSA